MRKGGEKKMDSEKNPFGIISPLAPLAINGRFLSVLAQTRKWTSDTSK